MTQKIKKCVSICSIMDERKKGVYSSIVFKGNKVRPFIDMT